MAKIKINGDSSGYVELAAPNAAHNNTLELGPGTKILTDKNTHTGSIGFGTDNPATDFHIHSPSSGTNSEILLTNGDTGSSATDGFKIALNTGAGGEIWNYENDYIRFGTNNAERLRILSGGQVIIGDSASDLSGTHTFMACGSKHALQFDGNTGTYLSFTLGSANGNVDIEADARSGGYPDLTFTTYNDERLRITSGGKIGIGITNPEDYDSEADDLVIGSGGADTGITVVCGSGVGSHGSIFFADGTSSSGAKKKGQIRYEQNNEIMSFHTNEQQRLTIDLNGNVTLGYAGNSLYFQNGFNNSASRIQNGGASGSANLKFYTNNAGTEAERLRIGPGGGHRIQCDESWHAANLSECNTEKLALNINKTRQGQTKGIAIGCVGGGSGSTGIQCYDTSNNSANNLELNPFGGNVGINQASPTVPLSFATATGQKIEFYNSGTNNEFGIGVQSSELRISSGSGSFIAFRTGGYGGSERLRITAAGHKWTNNGSIFHGSNDVSDFTDAARDTYNNVSIRAGNPNAGTTPTNNNSAIKIYPAGTRGSTTGNLTGGIAWQHLDPNNGSWGSTYGEGAQIWMGAALHDTPGQERDRFNLWMNSGTTGNSQPGNLAIEAYPNGMVRHPKVPAFLAKGGTALSNGSAIVIVGSGTEFNNGGHYSTSNGRFTAPIDGIYHFSFWGLLYPHSSGVMNIYYSRNGSQYGHLVQGGADSNNHTSRAGSIMMSMSAGDYAELRINRGNNTGVNAYGSQWNMCGFLVG